MLGGRLIGGMPSHRVAAAGVSRAFQLVNLFGSMTVAENVLVGAERHARLKLWQAVSHLAGFAAERRAAGNPVGGHRPRAASCWRQVRLAGWRKPISGQRAELWGAGATSSLVILGGRLQGRERRSTCFRQLRDLVLVFCGDGSADHRGVPYCGGSDVSARALWCRPCWRSHACRLCLCPATAASVFIRSLRSRTARGDRWPGRRRGWCRVGWDRRRWPRRCDRRTGRWCRWSGSWRKYRPGATVSWAGRLLIAG
jgi:hypothetical protein